jgi:hypothetical protein
MTRMRRAKSNANNLRVGNASGKNNDGGIKTNSNDSASYSRPIHTLYRSTYTVDDCR